MIAGLFGLTLTRMGGAVDARKADIDQRPPNVPPADRAAPNQEHSLEFYDRHYVRDFRGSLPNRVGAGRLIKIHQIKLLYNPFV